MPNPQMSRDAITLLRNDHKEVEALFKKCEKLMKGEQPSPELRELCMQIIQELSAHAEIEEQIFYPAMKQAIHGKDAKIIFESYEEHHVVKMVMGELEQMTNVDETFEAKLTVLMELVRHHVKEEEGEFFPQCREVCGRKLMREIGATMLTFKKQMMKQEQGAKMEQPRQVDEIIQRVQEEASSGRK